MVEIGLTGRYLKIKLQILPLAFEAFYRLADQLLHQQIKYIKILAQLISEAVKHTDVVCEIHPINTVNLGRKSHLASLNITHLSNTRFVPENKKSAKSKKFKSDFESLKL